MKKIAIVLLHFRNLSSTNACLESLCKVDVPKDFEVSILVVDNSPKEPFVQKKKQCAVGEIIVLKNSENLGFSGGMNRGMAYALENGYEYVMILNNDTEVDKHFLKELCAAIEKEDVGIVVPKVYFYPGCEYHFDRYKESERGKVIWYAGGIMDWKNLIASNRGVDEVDHGQYDHTEETPLATGCCMLIKVSLLRRVGLLDTEYFLYYEDNDFNQRVKNAGYKIVFVPKAHIWHKNAKSSGVGSNLQDYYIARNRMLLGMKYASLRTKIALVRESIKLLLKGREWQKKGVEDYYLKRFGKGRYPI